MDEEASRWASDAVDFDEEQPGPNWLMLRNRVDWRWGPKSGEERLSLTYSYFKKKNENQNYEKKKLNLKTEKNV